MLARDEIVGKADDDGDDARKEFARNEASHCRFQLLIKFSATVFGDDVFDNPP